MYIHWQSVLLPDKFVHFQNLQMSYNRSQHGSEKIETIFDEIILDNLLYMITEMADFVVDHRGNAYITKHTDFQ